MTRSPFTMLYDVLVSLIIILRNHRVGRSGCGVTRGWREDQGVEC